MFAVSLRAQAMAILLYGHGQDHVATVVHVLPDDVHPSRGQSHEAGLPFPSRLLFHDGNNSSLYVLIAINGTWEAHVGATIRMSVATMSTKQVIVMILHAVLNRIHVSVPVTVHVERACSGYIMCSWIQGRP